MSTRVPSRATLGPFTYRITASAKAWRKQAPDDGLYGYTDHRRSRVLIYPETSDDMRRAVLLHEMLHAAAFAAGHIDNEPLTEERWVAMVAPMLLDALRRSPDLAAYLLDGVT